MKFGAVYVQSGIGYNYDRDVIRDFIQAAEDLGYDYLLIYDLLTKTNYTSPPVNDSEPFTLLSYAAALNHGSQKGDTCLGAGHVNGQWSYRLRGYSEDLSQRKGI